MLTASTSDEAAELHDQYCAQAGQIMIVPPGVDLHTFHPCNQPKSRAQFGVPQDIQVILFVGRIQPLKAPDVLIKAVAELARHDPGRHDRLQLIIIGSPSGTNAEWSQTLRPLAIDHGIEDMVDSAHTRPARNCSAGTASLTWWLCLPITSHLDSSRSRRKRGRPVVAADVGGLRHAVSDHYSGLLVRGHDESEWADALAAILDDHDEMIRMGTNAAAHAATFSWDNTAAATLQGYRLALTGSSSE